jgi:CRISPR system Cascade subunit CasD
MAAWGDIAVGERRGTWGRPSRSGVLGLVAAALGIERSEGPAHDRLEAGLGLAVCIDRPGRPLRDYHTAQSPSSRKNVRWPTRRDELDPENDLNTILSERSYLVDLDAIVLLWRRDGADVPTLPDIAQRLSEPKFVLFLGRKSCPLGLPLKPHLMQAKTPVAALDAYRSEAAFERAVLYRSSRDEARSRPELWLDEKDAHDFGLATHIAERTTRRDRVRDRPRWHFADRSEVLIDTGRKSA